MASISLAETESPPHWWIDVHRSLLGSIESFRDVLSAIEIAVGKGRATHHLQMQLELRAHQLQKSFSIADKRLADAAESAISTLSLNSYRQMADILIRRCAELQDAVNHRKMEIANEIQKRRICRPSKKIFRVSAPVHVDLRL